MSLTKIFDKYCFNIRATLMPPPCTLEIKFSTHDSRILKTYNSQQPIIIGGL